MASAKSRPKSLSPSSREREVKRRILEILAARKLAGEDIPELDFLHELLEEEEIAEPLSFREFVEKVKPKYRWFRHCEVLGDVLQRVADGELKRVMIFEPPRHGKSEETSRLFSAYFLYRYPQWWVSINSYAADLAFSLSREARANFRAAGGEIKSDAAAVSHWETTSGGGLFAAGVGGPITGKGFHLGIIDDPTKNAEEAASETIREKHKEWYSSTFYTREEPWSDDDPNGAIIVIQTRWHEDDLSGWLLSQEEEDEEPERWHIVSFAAIKEETEPEIPETCTLEPDWRQPGEALCPERRPIEKLKRIWKRIGDYFFGALFQQRPTAKEGSFFKVSRLEIVEAAPAKLRKVRAWDIAATANAGDYTVGLLMGAFGVGADLEFYVLDVVRGQWATDERNKIMRQTAVLDGKSVKILVPQDPGSAGVDVAKAFIKLFAGFKVVASKVTGDKATRADPLSSQLNAGNVKLVAGDWNRAFIEEYRQFPGGKNDDQVDTGSDAFNELAGTVVSWFNDPRLADEFAEKKDANETALPET